MKPSHLLLVGVLAFLVGVAIYHGRAVTVTTPAFSFAISAAPEIEGEHTVTDTGWLVRGPAVIRATRTNGTIRELPVPAGETRRVRVREDSMGMTLEVER